MTDEYRVAIAAHIRQSNDLAAWSALAVQLDYLLAAGDAGKRSILVTGIIAAAPTAAYRVAGALAANGWPTCLIDTNPSTAFGLMTKTDGLHDTDVANLTLRVIGRASSPQLAGRSDQSRALSDEVLKERAWAVWTGPPVTVAAGLAIAGAVDGVLLAVTPGRVKRADAYHARETLATVGARLLGMVLVPD